jgi:MurNAc alpha-1-phosphate uridylyltransferase
MTAPKKAFVLAAGIGERMRPLTDNCPKPLLKVGGRTMLDRALDALVAAGVEEAVVNTYYLPGMVEESLKGRTRPHITISREDKLLDTGGGVKRMLSFFGNEPFYVLNADVVWTDGAAPALTRLADMWDPAQMDLLLLLKATKDLAGWNGKSDYYLPEGSDRPIFRDHSDKPANYNFTGVRIVHPRLFDGETREAFGFLQLFHKAEAAGSAYALRHDGDWHHVGTPEAFAETNRILSTSEEKQRAGMTA